MGGGGETYKPGYVTSDVELHAQWRGLSNTIKYATGTTDLSVLGPADETFTSGAPVVLPADLLRAGYTFTGWFDENGTRRVGTYIPEPTASGEITLTGRWSTNRYTVTFDTFGGSAVANTTFETGGSFKVPSAPTRTGHTFVGWFDAATGGAEYSGTVSPSTLADFTLYARWTKDPIIVPVVVAPVASLSLNVEAGARVTGATVSAKAEGLAPQAPYEIELRSNPQIIARGFAVDGTADVQAPIPAGLQAGWHTLTFRSTAFDGTAVTRVVYFEITASGILLKKTTVMPAELANTGVVTRGSSQGLAGLGSALLLTGLTFIGAVIFRRQAISSRR